MKVLIMGAAGNVGPSTVAEMEERHELVLTDLRPMETRHPFLRVNVMSPDDVMAACRGVDAVVDLTVMRQNPQVCFDINVWGTYNLLRAAVAQGVKRVVHTGPTPMGGGYPADYWDDFGLNEECPPRPGTSHYILSKYMAEEICRAFAHEHESLSVLCMRLIGVWSHTTAAPEAFVAEGAHLVDIAQALRLAVEAKDLPSNFEIFHVYCDNPTGRAPIDKAKRLLGYRPQVNHESAWRAPTA